MAGTGAIPRGSLCSYLGRVRASCIALRPRSLHSPRMHPLQHPTFHLALFWAHFKAYSAMVGLTAKETKGFVVMCRGSTAQNGEVGHGKGSAAPLPCPALCHLPSPKPPARLDVGCPRPAAPAAHPANPSLLANSLHPTWCRKKITTSQLILNFSEIEGAQKHTKPWASS